MTLEEKKAFDSLKEDLYNYPEMVMVTVVRKELEVVINYMKKVQKNNEKSLEWAGTQTRSNRYI